MRLKHLFQDEKGKNSLLWPPKGSENKRLGVYKSTFAYSVLNISRPMFRRGFGNEVVKEFACLKR